jgi:hypothetical protein
MRVFVVILALFPILAAAQGWTGAQDLGTYQITSGTISNGGGVSGNGFTGAIGGGPEFLSYPIVNNFYGGIPSLNFCFGCGLPGTDDGVGSMYVTGLNDPKLAGLVQVFGFEGYLESGELTVSPTIDITGAGTYSAPFSMSADLAFGPSRTATPTKYADFVGNGTVTLDIARPMCYSNGICGPLRVTSVGYTFAPELDPASLSGALTLLGGGLLVLRGRRSLA